jgi:hypothetical protein
MRVRYDLLYEPIPALSVGALDVVAERVFVDIRDLAPKIASLFVEKSFAIRDEELHIANLGAVDRGVVNFVQNSV